MLDLLLRYRYRHPHHLGGKAGRRHLRKASTVFGPHGRQGKRRSLTLGDTGRATHVLKPVERELKVGKPQTLPQPCIFESLVLRIQTEEVWTRIPFVPGARLKRIRYILGHVHLVHVHNSLCRLRARKGRCCPYKKACTTSGIPPTFRKIPVKEYRKHHADNQAQG